MKRIWPCYDCLAKNVSLHSLSKNVSTNVMPDLASPRQIHELYLTLVTLLFSYAYESRTTQHDPTPESAWTICTLTPAFSALDPPRSSSDVNSFTHDEILETLVPSYRRSLAFPLHRSFILSEACQRDVSRLLSRGKRLVFRCLLEVKSILDHHEVYYVYSKIWIDDLCVWIQAYARFAAFPLTDDTRLIFLSF